MTQRSIGFMSQTNNLTTSQRALDAQAAQRALGVGVKMEGVPMEFRPIRTADALPEKPGKQSYEHVLCLIFVNGDWEVSQWNCEHLCWDDCLGDDFRYHPKQPSHWWPLPLTPETP